MDVSDKLEGSAENSGCWMAASDIQYCQREDRISLLERYTLSEQDTFVPQLDYRVTSYLKFID